MNDRKKAAVLTPALFQLAGLLALVCVVSLPFRKIAFGVVVVALGLLTVLILYHLINRQNQQFDESHAWLYEGRATDTTALTVVVRPPLSTDQCVERLRSIDWFQFEKLVAALFQNLGYSVSRRGGAKPDGDVDLLIQDGAEQVAVQCKHWQTWNVGVQAVREFLGALTDAGLKKGIFVTLRGCAEDAQKLAEKHGVEILNETGLAKLLESMKAGANPEILAILNDTRKHCPRCESEMVLRTATKGANAGCQFWGCSTYPQCRYTLPVISEAA